MIKSYNSESSPGSRTGEMFRDLTLNYDNYTQIMDDEMFLEALLASSLCVYSPGSGLGGLPLYGATIIFVRQLQYEYFKRSPSIPVFKHLLLCNQK